MHHALFMGVLQTQGRLTHIVAGVRDRQRTFFLQHILQVGPFHEIHDQNPQLTGAVGVERPDDVGMIELGGGTNLAIEAFQGTRVVEEGLVDDLEGNQNLHEAMLRLVDDAHTAAAQFAEDEEFGVIGQFGRQVGGGAAFGVGSGLDGSRGGFAGELPGSPAGNCVPDPAGLAARTRPMKLSGPAFSTA